MGKPFDDPGLEAKFRHWFARWANQPGNMVNPDPDHKEHYYDYRAAWRAGVSPPPPGGHWPSRFKTEDHPNRFIQGIDTITGSPMTQNQMLLDLARKRGQNPGR